MTREREGTTASPAAKMSSGCLQVLSLTLSLSLSLVTVSSAHLLDADGFHRWRFNLPQGPHPLALPPHLQHLPPPRTPFLPLQPPPQVILIPVHVRGTFPPFIERIVQRIQTWWSFYNPPEMLTRPPPSMDAPATNSPKKKPKPSPTTTPVPKQDSETEVTTEPPETSPTADSSVSTLAVYEVTPSGDSAPEDTEEPLITPERASLLGGHREAYLRFLQTGTLPPYLESDTLNDMDD